MSFCCWETWKQINNTRIPQSIATFATDSQWVEVRKALQSRENEPCSTPHNGKWGYEAHELKNVSKFQGRLPKCLQFNPFEHAAMWYQWPWPWLGWYFSCLQNYWKHKGFLKAQSRRNLYQNDGSPEGKKTLFYITKSPTCLTNIEVVVEEELWCPEDSKVNKVSICRIVTS